MLENDKHREAYEYYYGLGDRRTLQEVAEKFTTSRQSITKWKKEFDWDSRISKRDLKVLQDVEKRISKAIVQEKYEYHQQISTNIKLIRAMVSTAYDKIKNKEIKVNTLHDFNTAMWVFERLIRLDLYLLGEPDKILLKFQGDITLSEKDKEIAELSDDKLNEYIDTLSERNEIPLLSGEEEEGDRERPLEISEGIISDL